MLEYGQKRAVRIPLGCILVYDLFLQLPPPDPLLNTTHKICIALTDAFEEITLNSPIVDAVMKFTL